MLISKLTTKSQTVLPQEVRKLLALKPGDYISYHVRGRHVEIERLSTNTTEDDPFYMFSEWASKADDEAYGSL